MSILNSQEQELIAQAISRAEKSTSGEIRIALEKHHKGDALERAKEYFFKLKMHNTALHNGVLIYMAYGDKKFAIIGDTGINKVVPNDFWETTKIAMKTYFTSGNISEGLIAGVTMAGEQLSTFFPHQSDDINELPDDIFFIDQQEKH